MRTSTRLILTVWLLVLSLWCDAATVVTRTIRPDGTGNYTNLVEWENARQRDLVAADEIEMAVIEGTWTNPEPGPLSINGWTTDSTRYIIITNSTSKHGGSWNSSAYRLEITNTTFGPMQNYQNFTKVYGIQLKLTASSGSPSLIGVSGSMTLQDCILRGDVTGSGDSFFVYGSGGPTVKLYNCIAYNSTNSKCIAFIGDVSAWNCTVANVNRGFYYATSATNCIAQGTGTDAFGGTTGDYNCSQDATAPGGNSIVSYDVPFVSETVGSENFHLMGTATSVIGAGLDNASSVTTDIDGQTRSDWDIGADEYIAPSSGQVVIITTQ